MNTAPRSTTIEIDTAPFVRSHLRQPRGFGSWAFALDPNPQIEAVVFSPSMTWGDAKRWAKQWARDEQSAGRIPSFVKFLVLYAQP